MGNPLRDRRTAAEFAAIGQDIEIFDKIGSFEGLVSIIEADLAALSSGSMPSGWRDCIVVGCLQFGFADTKHRVPMLTGNVTADVAAYCQRCLRPFQLRLEIEPKLLLLQSQQSVGEIGEIDVWELQEPTMRPHDIVEELLIMAMPFSAMHDNGSDCKELPTATSLQDGSEEDLVKPFAALRTQMK